MLQNNLTALRIKGGARGGGVDLIMRKKYRENFIKYDKNIARISPTLTKISRYFSHEIIAARDTIDFYPSDGVQKNLRY